MYLSYTPHVYFLEVGVQQDSSYLNAGTFCPMPHAHCYLGTYFQVVLWSAVEPNVGVTSACLPSCRPIFKICVKSIVTLKESTFGIRSTRSTKKNNTGDHDFVRLVGTEGALHASHGIPLQQFGVRTKVTGNPPADRYESSIQSGEVHVRRDVEVQEG